MKNSNYSVEGNYIIEGKIVFEERIYNKAYNEESAIKMAKEEGLIGEGMVFHNLANTEECKAGSGGFISLERLALMTISTN